MRVACIYLGASLQLAIPSLCQTEEINERISCTSLTKNGEYKYLFANAAEGAGGGVFPEPVLAYPALSEAESDMIHDEEELGIRTVNSIERRLKAKIGWI
jgi:hypothetical protein